MGSGVNLSARTRLTSLSPQPSWVKTRTRTTPVPVCMASTRAW